MLRRCLLLLADVVFRGRMTVGQVGAHGRSRQRRLPSSAEQQLVSLPPAAGEVTISGGIGGTTGCYDTNMLAIRVPPGYPGGT
jgi:hypothetical protein